VFGNISGAEKLTTENIEKKNVSDESYFVLRWTMIKNSQLIDISVEDHAICQAMAQHNKRLKWIKWLTRHSMIKQIR
jgi:hypothetical protein